MHKMTMQKCFNSSPACLKWTGAMPREVALPLVENMLVDSIKQLNPRAAIPEEESSSIAELVYDSMTVGGRVYHSMEHVFDISQNMEDPALVLSALFHDVVYFSIDKAFLPKQQKLIDGIIEMNDDQLYLANDLHGDELVNTIVDLFGFKRGEELPKSGTNEFISGLVGVKILSKWLDKVQLLEVATCIEATIPFRPILEGKSPMDRLYDRLKAVCPGQPEEWLLATVTKAATTANFDLCSFDSDDRNFFLDSSWKLIPEARPILLEHDCPLLEWDNELKALEGRTKFLMGVVPRIFQQFGGVPTDEEMAEKQRKTHENLNVMWEYTKVRQLHSMVLVAVVEAMGGDPSTFSLRSCLTMDVPNVSCMPEAPLTDREREARYWLVNGRRTGFDWDPAASPLGAYLFDKLGSNGVEEAISIGKNQSPGSFELLKHLPKEIIVTVSSGLGAVFTDRADGFHQVPEKVSVTAQ
jgi:hypothetical protein